MSTKYNPIAARECLEIESSDEDGKLVWRFETSTEHRKLVRRIRKAGSHFFGCPVVRSLGSLRERNEFEMARA
jgi:hypothetical protein